MKNLANCKPSEFLAQTVKIRRYVSEWLTLTKIMEIRKNQPDLKEGASEEETNQAKIEQSQKNLWSMFDSIMEDNAEKTLGLLALINFVDPADVDKHTMAEYIGSLNEVINCPEVINFFMSLVQLGQMNISKQLKA